jgi:hypothetical protein
MEAMADMSYREAKHPEGDPAVNSTCHVGDSRSVVSSSETVFPRSSTAVAHQVHRISALRTRGALWVMHQPISAGQQVYRNGFISDLAGEKSTPGG